MQNQDDQDDKKRERKKLEEHPRFRDFQSGDFVLVGKVKKLEKLGSTKQSAGENEVETFFNRIKFFPAKQLRGNYFQLEDDARKLAKLPGVKQRTLTAIYTASTDEFGDIEDLEDQAFIVVLEYMRASTMAGTIPVRIKHIAPASKELLRVAEAAATKK